MATLKQLANDLERLDKHYSELSDLPLNTQEDANTFKREWIKAGKLIINFYNNSFIPNYSKIQNPILEEVNMELSKLSSFASNFVENKKYFGLSNLLIPKGNKVGDPTYLGELIQEIKNSLEIKN